MAKKKDVSEADQKAAMEKISKLLEDASTASKKALKEAEKLAKAAGLELNTEYVNIDDMLDGEWEDGYTDEWTGTDGKKHTYVQAPRFSWMNSSFNC